MALTTDQLRELRDAYRDLINYQAFDMPIDPLTYVDSNGDTLLHIAAARDDKRTVGWLLAEGVAVDGPGDMGCTALQYALSRDMQQLLLAHGACPDAVNEFGERLSLLG